MFSKFWHKTLGRPFTLNKAIDVGFGNNQILLIHGLGTNSATWKPLLLLLDKKRWHIIACDLLGFGKSPKPDYIEYSVDQHVKALLHTLGRAQRKPMIIVGHSMGCLVASHLAFIRPDLVKQLVLYEPPLFADSPEFRSHSRRRKLYFALYQQLLQRPALLVRYSNFVALFAHDRVMQVNNVTWLPFERSLKNTIMKQQAYRELRQINVPTNIIHGTFDLIVTRTDVKNMLEANKNISFHLINQNHDVNRRATRFIVKLLKPA